jgi:heptosyltransferase III
LLAAAGRLLGARLGPSVREPRRVLLLRPDHIGDVLLSAPAVAALRAAFPESELTYLVGPWSAEVARRGPPADVQTLSFPGFTRRRQANLVAPYALLAQAALRLRRRRYDLAVVPRPDHWWGALLALAAGIPTRVGFDLPETRPLLSHAVPLDPQQHAAEQALSLAVYAAQLYGRRLTAAAAEPTFRVCDAERQAAARLLAERGLARARRLVAIQPSSGAALKSWPVAVWAELADRLLATGVEVVLVGGPDDRSLLASIQAHQARPAPTLAGQSLGVSAALYARCALLVGLDGGGPHLAAAVGTPTVRLYGPASPAKYGPWPPRADQRVLLARGLACVPCGHLEDPPCGARRLPACLVSLSVDEVFAAVSDLLFSAR